MPNEVRVGGLDQPVRIVRDRWGIPHVTASTETDAWFGLGYACAQDRLWQMESDRRRAVGRWAEVVGESALSFDRIARRLQLQGSCEADVDAMSPETRNAFGAYAAGVNAWIGEGVLPPEFSLTETTRAPWEPWHSVAVFKIRHVLMGTWQAKLAQARLLAVAGAEAFRKLDVRPPPGSPAIVPPSGAVAQLFAHGAAELSAAADDLGRLGEAQAGSNSWAIHGARTASGLPLLVNDSHRLLEVPNVYWQAHLRCPRFDVIGVTFAGLPGFSHFGHNGLVAWNVTHAMADYQDLYVESFDPTTPGRYRVSDGWATAELRHEIIRVRDAADEPIELWRTKHGPVVHGDPRSGFAIALRYTAIDRPSRTFEVLRPMLSATSVSALIEAQRGWVDPVNNLVCADVHGDIGYLTRGELPVRSSDAHRGLPAPGWTGESEWLGRVPFDQMPKLISPPEGFIVTANNAILEADQLYIGFSFAEPYRAERIREVVSSPALSDADAGARLQADVTSTAARRWTRFLAGQPPLGGDAERARQMLVGWDAELLDDSAPALLYACFRRQVARALFEPVIGEHAWRWLIRAASPPHEQIVRRWLGNIVARLEIGVAPPDGSSWHDVLQDALASAWTRAIEIAGDEPGAWRWADVHGTAAVHPLSSRFPDRRHDLDFPTVGVGGDEDTVRCAGYSLGSSASFDVALTSVYRQVVDLSDPASATWVIPGGASGVPGSKHHHDQLAAWGRGDRIPMLYRQEAVEAGAASSTLLVPAGAIELTGSGR